jgi:ABC-type glycerol-3-phosphate transport system permease component
MKNSLIVSVGTVLVCVATAVGIAFALTFLRWPGRRLVYWTCLALLAVPPLTLMVPVYEVLVQLGVVDTRVGITLLYSAFSIPFAVYLLVSYMRTLPKEVIEAAVLDGTPVLRLAWEVVLPLTTPAIATAAVLTFLFAWNEVIYAFLVLQSNGNRTLAAGLTGLIGRYYTNFPILLAGLLLSVLPVGAVYVYFQRYLVSGIAVGVE